MMFLLFCKDMSFMFIGQMIKDHTPYRSIS